VVGPPIRPRIVHSALDQTSPAQCGSVLHDRQRAFGQVLDAQALEIGACAVDVHVGHQRLEIGVRARDRREVRARLADLAGLQRDVQPASLQAARAVLQPLERDGSTQCGQQRGVGVEVVGEPPLEALRDDRVWQEHRRLARVALDGVAHAHDRRRASVDEHLVGGQWTAGRQQDPPDQASRAGGRQDRAAGSRRGS